MVIAFRTAVEVALQLARMDQFLAMRALQPAAKSVLLRGLNLNFRLISRKQTHTLPN